MFRQKNFQHSSSLLVFIENNKKRSLQDDLFYSPPGEPTFIKITEGHGPPEAGKLDLRPECNQRKTPFYGAFSLALRSSKGDPLG